MLFNSIEFLLFLNITVIFYWTIFSKNLKLQNIFLLFLSYIFYAGWDYRFLLLILVSTITDYFIGLKLFSESAIAKRKFLLTLSVIVNLGILGIFKYSNFFIDSFISFLRYFGFSWLNPWSLNIILPVGISFYTFQTMSYTIDIYRNKIRPTKDFIPFAAFVSFFPQLVAGPIERAKYFMPQITQPRQFSSAQMMEGVRLILWGMFKKVVIADSLAPIVDQIFSGYNDYNGGVLFLGAVYFAFQIYGDFSGYSDIAIGSAKLLGFELSSNFKFPYFSRNIGEFWRRWHISLSSFFKDYLFIPLGGSRGGRLKTILNTFTVFLVSGLWHGANWTYVFWGLIHVILYVPGLLIGNNIKFKDQSIRKASYDLYFFRDVMFMLVTFFWVTLAWVFFRSPSIEIGLEYSFQMLKFDWPNQFRSSMIMVLLLVLLEWQFKDNERKIQVGNRHIDLCLLIFICTSILLCWNGEQVQFIYFRF